jgi:hypothetical protein
MSAIIFNLLDEKGHQAVNQLQEDCELVTPCLAASPFRGKKWALG